MFLAPSGPYAEKKTLAERTGLLVERASVVAADEVNQWAKIRQAVKQDVTGTKQP